MPIVTANNVCHWAAVAGGPAKRNPQEVVATTNPLSRALDSSEYIPAQCRARTRVEGEEEYEEEEEEDEVETDVRAAVVVAAGTEEVTEVEAVAAFTTNRAE